MSTKSHIHIHCPPPTDIRDLPPTSGEQDRFGRWIIKTDCCRKHRTIENCEMVMYEWYDPYIRCKKGKGCK